MATYNQQEINGQTSLTLVEPVSVLHLNQDVKLDIQVESNQNVMVLLDINECTSLSMDALVQPYASLDIAIISMQPHAHQANYTITLLDGSTTNIRSCFLGNANKKTTMNIIHRGPHTTSTMEHYGLVNTEHPFKIEAIGTIEKKADDTQCRQALRALTFSDKDHVSMIPSLYIDNYNCQASHSTSIGAMSPKQLYYLQSRGLTMDAITLLLAKGYIQPVLELIHDPSLKEMVQTTIESEVINACLTKTK